MNSKELAAVTVIAIALVSLMGIRACAKYHEVSPRPPCHDSVVTVDVGSQVTCDVGAVEKITTWSNAGTRALVTVECVCN